MCVYSCTQAWAWLIEGLPTNRQPPPGRPSRVYSNHFPECIYWTKKQTPVAAAYIVTPRQRSPFNLSPSPPLYNPLLPWFLSILSSPPFISLSLSLLSSFHSFSSQPSNTAQANLWSFIFIYYLFTSSKGEDFQPQSVNWRPTSNISLSLVLDHLLNHLISFDQFKFNLVDILSAHKSGHLYFDLISSTTTAVVVVSCFRRRYACKQERETLSLISLTSFLKISPKSFKFFTPLPPPWRGSIR